MSAYLPLGPVTRPVGLETEFGILEPGNPYANAVAMASRVVDALSLIHISEPTRH